MLVDFPPLPFSTAGHYKLSNFVEPLAYLMRLAQDVFLMDPKISGFLPRCAYFSGFKGFSKNGKKVNEIAKTEATVTSREKNCYLFWGLPEVP